MYKITVTRECFKLWRYDGTKYTMLGKFTNSERLIEYYEVFVMDTLQKDPSINPLDEIYEALKGMRSMDHNVAELGRKGAYTVSYWEEGVV